MSSSRTKCRGAGRLMGVVALWVALAGLTTPTGSQVRSSAEDRQRFVSITRSLEQAPLNPGLNADRAWALAWVTDAPDITVNVCAQPLGGLVKSDYPYTGEIVVQDMFSIAVLLIEHPETANDPNAQQLAGVEGALNAYHSVLKDRPEAKSSALENLLEIQSKGELPEFVRKAWIRCSAKK
jgi:hypothetical protein